ncbi:hypothetical protein PAMP_001757 [Pampus punctatissimus]
MESLQFSSLSSLRGEFKSENYIEPHYKESYRLAIDHLLKGGRDCYQEFLIEERIGSFLSEQELLFITANAEPLPPQNPAEEINNPTDSQSSSGTYWPMHSDVDTPDLDLGWPEFMHEQMQTNIDLLFHPPRQNNPTIKEVIRKCIRDARQVIAIVMDTFTDVDIFKETIDASIRGVPVYVLLADSHLKSFLTMAENQDVKIQQLRNMRVRTVKGQDYLCGSGAKFHGAMEQKFLLIDCHTAIYGSYSLTWSFEKINLSMVQVITGHLVKSYDEEFRTLYARSTVPAELCPPEGLFPGNGPHGLQIFQNCVSHSAQKIDRRDQLRITLDTVYRKTCERKLDARDLEESLLEEEFNKLGPMVENGIGVQNQMLQFQSAEMENYLKRHSYAGERQSGYIPQSIRSRASNWNICRDMVNGTYNYPKDNYLQMPQMYRGQNMRQSNSGNDNAKMLSMQQNTQPLDCTSKSFMRTWRIESYFNNPDIPYKESCDYLDQFEPQDKASSFMQGKIRSSLAFRSIPEQMEPNRHINNMLTGVGASAAPNSPLPYSSKQWNPTAAAENRIKNDEFMLKRQSLSRTLLLGTKAQAQEKTKAFRKNRYVVFLHRMTHIFTFIALSISEANRSGLLLTVVSWQPFTVNKVNNPLRLSFGLQSSCINWTSRTESFRMTIIFHFTFRGVCGAYSSRTNFVSTVTVLNQGYRYTSGYFWSTLKDCGPHIYSTHMRVVLISSMFWQEHEELFPKQQLQPEVEANVEVQCHQWLLGSVSKKTLTPSYVNDNQWSGFTGSLMLLLMYLASYKGGSGIQQTHKTARRMSGITENLDCEECLSSAHVANSTELHLHSTVDEDDELLRYIWREGTIHYCNKE